MDDARSLSHTRWVCKYHVVWIPKYRRKSLYGSLRKHLGLVFRGLARQKECEVEEGHLMPDHVHMLLSIPPKYAVSQVVGFLKGKSAIHIARTYLGRRKNFQGRNTSGREATTSPRSAETRKPSVSTSRSRRKRTSASTNWTCLRSRRHPRVAEGS